MFFKCIAKKVIQLLSLKKKNASKQPQKSDQRQAEILHLKRRLEEYEIEFSCLLHRPSGPKTPVLLEISKNIAQQKKLLDDLSPKREVAVQQLLASGVCTSRKVLEEHYKFIISMAHIFGGPYPYLREYIRVGKVNKGASGDSWSTVHSLDI